MSVRPGLSPKPQEFWPVRCRASADVWAPAHPARAAAARRASAGVARPPPKGVPSTPGAGGHRSVKHLGTQPSKASKLPALRARRHRLRCSSHYKMHSCLRNIYGGHSPIYLLKLPQNTYESTLNKLRSAHRPRSCWPCGANRQSRCAPHCLQRNLVCTRQGQALRVLRSLDPASTWVREGPENPNSQRLKRERQVS